MSDFSSEEITLFIETAAGGGDTLIESTVEHMPMHVLKIALTRVKLGIKNLGKGSKDPEWKRAKDEYQRTQTLIENALKRLS